MINEVRFISGPSNNGVEVLDLEEFAGMLKELVNLAFEAYPTRGEHTDVGLVYHFLSDKGMLSP